MLQDVRVSVGRTWRFVTPEGQATVMEDLPGYRQRLDRLKSRVAGTGFGLPCPPYRSTLWGNLLGDAYQQTRTKVLVAALLPLLLDDVVAPESLESQSGEPLARLRSAEAFLHPFAVTTVLSLDQVRPWQDESEAPGVLDELLRHPLDGEQPRQVRNGVPLALLPALPARDFDGNPASFEPAGSFTVLSGLHQAEDPGPLSYRLASLYLKKATDKSREMNTERSAISVTDRRVGMLLLADGNAGSRVECLHHNIITLLAYIENLATVVPGPATQSCEWFAGRAALILNHLYRRAPLPVINGIYKSRVAEMWIDHRDLAGAINRVNAQNQPFPPALPET